MIIDDDPFFFYTTALFVGLFLGAIALYVWEIARKVESGTAPALLAVLYSIGSPFTLPSCGWSRLSLTHMLTRHPL